MSTALGEPRSRMTADLIGALRWCLAHREGVAGTELADRLYVDWYLSADASDAAVMVGVPRTEEVAPVAAYRAAHAHDAMFQPGWRVERISSRGRLLVTDGTSSRVLNRVDVLPLARTLLPPRPGDPVQIAARHDLVDDAGFWFTFLGEWETKPPASVVRFYWAVRRFAAPGLVGRLTALLPRDVPAALKVGAARHLLGRPDAAVLYLSAEATLGLVGSLRQIARELGEGLGGRTPPLALPLARGLAVAEEPADSTQSFGQHRCMVLAEVGAALDGAEDDDTLLKHARAALAQAGVDALHPYRSAGSRLGSDW